MVLLAVTWLCPLPVLTWEGPRGTTETGGLGPAGLRSTLTLCFPGFGAGGRPASPPPGSRRLTAAPTLSEVMVLLGHTCPYLSACLRERRV